MIAKALMRVSGDLWSCWGRMQSPLTSCSTFSFSTGTSSNVFTLRGLFLLLFLKAGKPRGQHKAQAGSAPVAAQFPPHTAQFPGPLLFCHLLCLITNTNKLVWFFHQPYQGRTVKYFFSPTLYLLFSPSFYCTPAIHSIAQVFFHRAGFGVGFSIRTQGDVQWNVVFAILWN